MANFKEDLTTVRAFVFDCDGVFTDGSILTLPSGEMLRTFNTKDGFAVALALKRGYHVAIISGGKGEAMFNRFSMLGIKDIYLGCGNKLRALKEFCAKYNLDSRSVMFMGDDIPDVEPMMAVGMAVCPSDSVAEVKAVSRYVSNVEGGRGCVRDVVEQVLKAQQKWASVGSEEAIFSV